MQSRWKFTLSSKETLVARDHGVAHFLCYLAKKRRIELLEVRAEDGITWSPETPICMKNVPMFIRGKSFKYGCVSMHKRLMRAAFAKLWKASINFILSVGLSVCLSVWLTIRMEKVCSHWTDIHEIWYLSNFRVSVERKKNQVSLGRGRYVKTQLSLYLFY